MKMSRPILPILTIKLVVMATSLEPSEKGSNRQTYDQIPTICKNLGKSVQYILSSLCSNLFKKKKKLTQAEHYSLRGMHAARAK